MYRVWIVAVLRKESLGEKRPHTATFVLRQAFARALPWWSGCPMWLLRRMLVVATLGSLVFATQRTHWFPLTRSLVFHTGMRMPFIRHIARA